jgi:peptide deformylase
MAFRNIVTWPSPALRKESTPILEFNDELNDLVQDLYDTLNIVTGVGLAAPQIGVARQVAIIDMSQCQADNPSPSDNFPESILVLVNPVLELSGPEYKWIEACLSVPDSKGYVKRNQHVKVTYYTMAGEKKVAEFDYPASGVIQHECDHLEGMLYIGRMSNLSRNMLTKKIIKKRKKLAAARLLIHREEENEMAVFEGPRPSPPKKSTSATKKRKKRAAKKNHLSKRGNK